MLVILGVFVVLFTLYSMNEVHRSYKYTEYLKQNAAKVNFAKLRNNFHKSWFWDYNFERMVNEGQ